MSDTYYDPNISTAPLAPPLSALNAPMLQMQPTTQPDVQEMPQGAAPAYSGGFAPSGGALSSASGTAPTGALASASSSMPSLQELLRRGYPLDQALRMSSSFGTADPKYVQSLADQGTQLAGIGGPLSQQWAAIENAQTDSAAAKKAAIQKGLDTLTANQAGQTSNLPLMAAAAALLSPTKSGSFSESLGNAIGSAVPVTQAQRQQQNQQAKLMSDYGVAGADVDTDLAKQQTASFFDRMKMADDDLRYAAATGQRTDANINTNNTRLATNANTVNQRATAASMTNDYRTNALALRSQGLDEKTANDQAILAVKQQLAENAGRALTQRENNDFNSKIDAAESNIGKTMQGMNLSPTEIRARALQNVLTTWKPTGTGSAPAPTAPANSSAAPGSKPSLDSIFQ